MAKKMKLPSVLGKDKNKVIKEQWKESKICKFVPINTYQAKTFLKNKYNLIFHYF